MMRYTCAVIALVSSLVFAFFQQPKRWLGIEPLVSTRTDVERLLGQCPQRNVEQCVYDTPRETIVVIYSDGLCEKNWPSGYNAPVDTVIRVEISPRADVSVKDLHLDLDSYDKKVRKDGSVLYVNVRDGVAITVFDETVGSITYGPTAKQDELRCPGVAPTEGTADAHDRLSVYGDIDAVEERTNLAAFAQLLRQQLTVHGYIITYGGRRSFENEAQRRLQCQANYLVKQQGLSRERFTTIDGGFRSERTVELYVLPKGGRVPVPFPTLRPSRVQRIEEKNSTSNPFALCSD